MPRILRLALAFFISGTLAYFSYNVLCLLLDPYNIIWNRREMARGGWIPEQLRYFKTEHLLRTPDRNETVVLGNSRGVDLRTSDVSRTLDRPIYNFSVSSDHPAGYLMKAKWLAKSQAKLKDVVILLWYDQFLLAGEHGGILLAREHPAVSGESWLHYYWAFSELPLETAKKVVWHYVRMVLGLPYDNKRVINNYIIPSTGDIVLLDTKPDEDARDWRLFQDRVRWGKPGVIHFRQSSLSPEQQELMRPFDKVPMQDIQRDSFVELIQLLRSSGIRHHCIVPPMNAHVVRWVPRDKYIRWIQFIVRNCGETWDFSLPNSVTNGDFNYLDWSHYNGEIGRLMLIKTLGGNDSHLENHPDFGLFLTQSNSGRYGFFLDEAAMRGVD